MAISNDIEKVLSEFSKHLVDDTRSSLQKKLDERAARYGSKKKITSRLWTSVNAPITYENGNIILRLQMNDYWEVVDKGRKASGVSAEGQAKIAQWSDTRGVAEKIRIADLATRQKKQGASKRKAGLKKLKKMPFEKAKKAAGFLIARSLKKKNLEPTNFFSEVIKDGRVDELYSALTEIFSTDINIEISKI
jgi:hypothetical protein